VTTLVTLQFAVTYDYQFNQNLLSEDYPPEFVMSVEQLNLLALISSDDLAIADNIDAYVSGIYIQKSYNTTTKESSEQYI
jgi:hypothetical protein